MKFVLVRFQVPQLRELLVAVVQSAAVGLRGRVHDLVRANVAVLGEGFATDVALVRPFARMSAFVGFEVAVMIRLDGALD